MNARFVKPLDTRMIVKLAERTGAVLTAEEHVGEGGFGAAVLEAISQAGVDVRTRCLAVPDELVEHGDPKTQRARFGLDAEGIERAVVELVGRGS